MSASYLRRLGNWLPANIVRIFVNHWPPFLALGIKVEKNVENKFKHIEVSLKLHWYNINYVGVHFGGGIYSMVDPFYMLMLIKNLGENYIVWDKAAHINFKKPGTGTLHATFIFTDEEIQAVRQQADHQEKYIFDKTVDIFNEQGEIVASVVKTLYVRRKGRNYPLSGAQS